MSMLSILTLYHWLIVGEKKNKGTWSDQPRPKRPVVKKPGEQSYSTTEEGGDDYIFLWQVIEVNVFVNLAWEEDFIFFDKLFKKMILRILPGKR